MIGLTRMRPYSAMSWIRAKPRLPAPCSASAFHLSTIWPNFVDHIEHDFTVTITSVCFEPRDDLFDGVTFRS